MKRAVLYLRVSTLDQTTANQERELREIAGGMGCEIVHVYKDHGVSGAKGRDKRSAFNALALSPGPPAARAPGWPWSGRGWRREDRAQRASLGSSLPLFTTGSVPQPYQKTSYI